MRVLIIEDEIPAQRLLVDLLNSMELDIEIVGCLGSVRESVNWFKQNPHPEIVLLDIQLSDGVSFDIMKEVNIESLIIFVTAYDEYAIRAFKVNSLDYLLKPVEAQELEEAFQKYDNYSKKFIQAKNLDTNYDELVSAIKNSLPEYRKRFLIRSDESWFQVPVEEIAYFYSLQKITFAVTFRKKEYPVDFSLENLKEQLDPDLFFKINRQFIVNLNAIYRVHSWFQGKLVLELNPAPEEKPVVGKDKAAVFKRWMDQ